MPCQILFLEHFTITVEAKVFICVSYARHKEPKAKVELWHFSQGCHQYIHTCISQKSQCHKKSNFISSIYWTNLYMTIWSRSSRSHDQSGCNAHAKDICGFHIRFSYSITYSFRMKIFLNYLTCFSGLSY